MTSKELRESFLRFFESKGHLRLPSASLIPQNDPTLLLVGAGMVPFKSYFMGTENPPRKRITTCQKCIRTPDVENVGKTSRHGTFFEMLGNFSFGDYFKQEIIPWAWEYLTTVLHLPEDRMYASVYLDDDEAYSIWRDVVGIPESRLVRFGKDDNFWEVSGGPGPCGPCSEIILDRGENTGCGSSDCKVGCDCDRFIELWNLVFIQFYKDDQGNYTPLTQKSIDTGLGLERAAAVLQGVDTIQEIDIIKPVIERIESLSGLRYGQNGEDDWAIRVITDHSRSVAFMASDGVIPGNEGRGYVMRRLLRRAIRVGRKIGLDQGFLPDVSRVSIDLMGDAYPELRERSEYVLDVIRAEEERFNDTLDSGMTILRSEIAALRQGGARELSGDVAFRLYDTYGFPLELTEEIASENGMTVDKDGFAVLMDQQRARARQARGAVGYAGSISAKYARALSGAPVRFVGYESPCYENAKVLRLIDGEEAVPELRSGESGEAVLDVTPFYGESGGQVGDTGVLRTPTGAARVLDAQRPSSDVVSHRIEVVEGRIQEGQECLASVDSERRGDIARNHTATHLLHRALKLVLGDHVAQAGSLVGPDRLRFDFTHLQQVTAEQLSDVERLVNERILEDIPVEVSETTLDSAMKSGAVALFGEKYGETVRMVSIGEFSSELCGGTHVRSTGQIGSFKILGESSIAAGVRRIEAVTGRGAQKRASELERKLRAIADLLKSSVEDAPNRVEKLLSDFRSLQGEVEALKAKATTDRVSTLVSQAVDIGGSKVVVAAVEDADHQQLRTICDEIRAKIGSGVVLLSSSSGGKLAFTCMVTKDLVEKGINAVDIVNAAARVAGGGGGGRPDMAQAGGRDPGREKDALQAGREYILASMNRMS
jgi:alanyl-tRNA synthetase